MFFNQILQIFKKEVIKMKKIWHEGYQKPVGTKTADGYVYRYKQK